jgi:hypothetical protein
MIGFIEPFYELKSRIVTATPVLRRPALPCFSKRAAWGLRAFVGRSSGSSSIAC